MSLPSVMVDDTDPHIIYSGQWFSDNNSLDTSGDSGPPYLSTLHGINGRGSFSYQFSGTAVNVTGSVQVARAPSNAGNTTWQCLVDGLPIAVQNPTEVNNRVYFCLADGLSDGLHSLMVNAIGTSNQTFWFDYLQYHPSSNVSLTDAAIMTDSYGAAMQYSIGWSQFPPGFMTSQTNANFNFTFTGVSLIWYGFYNSIDFPSSEGMATYSVDGNKPIPFPLNGGGAATVTPQSNQILFTINGLSAEFHSLEVVYTGNSSNAPLSLQEIIYSGLPLNTSTLVSSSFSSPSPSPSISPSTASAASFVISTSSSKIPVTTLVSPANTSATTSSAKTSPMTTSSATTGSVTSGNTSPTPTSTDPGVQAHRPGGNIAVTVGSSVAAVVFLFVALLWLRRRLKRSRFVDMTVPRPLPMETPPPYVHSTPSAPQQNTESRFGNTLLVRYGLGNFVLPSREKAVSSTPTIRVPKRSLPGNL